MSDVLQGNAEYLDVFEPSPIGDEVAARGLAIVTCMDSRVDPYAMLGMQQGDAKILRNAGGRVTGDVVRALVLGSYLLGVSRVLVIAHTDCLMHTGTDADLHAAIERDNGVDTRAITFHAAKGSLEAALADDVAKLRSHPLLPRELVVGGAVYDVETGALSPLDV